MNSASFISLEEINEGIQKSVDNATRYLNDALFLSENKRYQSSILLSMLSYEESGKALLLMEYNRKRETISGKQWQKMFCSHRMKNLIAIRTVWQDAHFKPRFPNWDTSQARFDCDWKNVFTYVDYDFENRKWTSPSLPKSFGVGDAEQFAHNAMANHAAKALKCIIRRAKESEKAPRL